MIMTERRICYLTSSRVAWKLVANILMLKQQEWHRAIVWLSVLWQQYRRDCSFIMCLTCFESLFHWLSMRMKGKQFFLCLKRCCRFHKTFIYVQTQRLTHKFTTHKTSDFPAQKMYVVSRVSVNRMMFSEMCRVMDTTKWLLAAQSICGESQ